MKHQLKIIIIIFLVFSPMIFWAIQNPEPYHQMEVRGKVVSKSLQSVDGYAVTLMGRYENSNEYYRLDLLETLDHAELTDKAVALSNANGEFLLRVTPKVGKFDFYKVKIVLPGNSEEFISNEFPATLAETRESVSLLTYSNESGCSCENTTSFQEVVVGFVHSFQGINIEIE